MKSKGFSLMEIMAALVVIGILTTMGIPAYRNFVEESKAKVCDTNLKALQTALEIYAIDNDVLPASLSQLQGKYIREAFNKIMNRPGAWKIEFAYILTGWREYGIAHAEFLKDEIAKGNIGLITCPKDFTNPSSGGISYGLNAVLAEITLGDYKTIPADAVLIADCDGPVFNGVGDLSKRHFLYQGLARGEYAQIVTKKGETYKSKNTKFGKGSMKKKGSNIDIDIVIP
ncbi:MAG: prepilin-type N-terminal cleavage/methylation domain-containing protein [Candidatus Omnitrophota bacterium]|jgi:prepilin-type N-terminal cleavage/methylation domain-containing protein